MTQISNNLTGGEGLLSIEEREILTSSPLRQDEAHRRKAYAYLDGLHYVPRYGSIAAFLHALSVGSLLDIGCGIGNLRAFISDRINYTGIDISHSAIECARNLFPEGARTVFIVGDIHEADFGEVHFDCAIWAGIGLGCGTNGSNLAMEDWRNIIHRMSHIIEADGVIVIECIESYKNDVVELTDHLHFISECNIELFGSIHSRRYMRVLQNIR